MIIGTAGHIDHGKTTLVRALTGVDTDRLKEAKARGISIELGYAYAPLPAEDGQGGAEAGVLGIIDVPGHERFVHTMAAGASGIDHVLLVVAADDGVMPQTREHLAIALLFGIAAGTVALTKADRADAARIAAARAEVAALLAGTALEGAPVFETAVAPDGTARGVDALREHLFAAARRWRQRRADGLFRLAVDRVFTLAGHGTVVTGTVFGGRVAVGDAPLHSASGRAVRVRSLHAGNRPADSGAAGERVALNLAGIDRDAITRGDWIADARVLQPAHRIDARLRLLADAPALGAWTPVHLHLGAAHRQAHVVPLQGDHLAPGGEARAQIVVEGEAPVFVVAGDRLILRNAQGTRTLGGGTVLDPLAPERRRRSAERMRWLDALDTLVDTGDAQALLAAAPAGLTRSALARLLGRWPAAQWKGAGDVPAFDLGDDTLWLAPAAWAAVRERIVQTLERHHARAPDEPGLGSARLQRMAFPAEAGAVQPRGWQAWLDRLVADGTLARTGAWLHLPDHRVTLGAAEQALYARLHPLLAAGGNDPPWVRNLARATGAREDAVRELLRKQARAGALHQVVKDLFYPAARIAALAQTVADLAAAGDGTVEARAFRDAVQLGRKRAIQILEFFDRVGYTRRVGDAHLVRPHTRWTDEGPATGAAP
ncbi:selenocysteine-specific translation elongation factor [Xylophilus sp.]|uniref:selenocysteine-specific translation elongation factor n=1 Tax=Xylophilus sp. TaxID=2653893 RepID=UPI0013B85D83|nr:selenocysteine-specific translation elongation factor [Xylophilus sp.]KAF1047432.1 MAG: Selenocysteine-specific elongation factor [Xylophilus sp.]